MNQVSRKDYVALLRHGDYHQQADTPSAWQPWPLTERGVAQAVEGGDQLRRLIREHGLEIPTEIHSSTLLRAWQTALGVAQSLGLEPQAIFTTDKLAERGVGAAANLTLAQIEQAVNLDPRHDPLPHDWKRSPRYRLPFPGAESLLAAGQRVAGYVEQVAGASEYPNSLHVFIGHGASLRHAAWHMGVLTETEVGQYSMFHATPVLLCRTVHGWHRIGGEWKRRHQYLD